MLRECGRLRKAGGHLDDFLFVTSLFAHQGQLTVAPIAGTPFPKNDACSFAVLLSKLMVADYTRFGYLSRPCRHDERPLPYLLLALTAELEDDSVQELPVLENFPKIGTPHDGSDEWDHLATFKPRDRDDRHRARAVKGMFGSRELDMKLVKLIRKHADILTRSKSQARLKVIDDADCTWPSLSNASDVVDAFARQMKADVSGVTLCTTDHLCASRQFVLDDNSPPLGGEQVLALFSQPLSEFGSSEWLRFGSSGGGQVFVNRSGDDSTTGKMRLASADSAMASEEMMPFDLSAFSDVAGSAALSEQLQRLEHDYAQFRGSETTATHDELTSITKAQIEDYKSSGDSSAPPPLPNHPPCPLEDMENTFTATRTLLERIQCELSAALSREIEAIQLSRARLILQANTDGIDGAAADAFWLRRCAGAEARLTPELLAAALASSCGADDLLRLNPRLAHSNIPRLLEHATALALRTTRVAQLKRALASICGTLELPELAVVLDASDSRVAGDAKKFGEAIERVIAELTAARHYVTMTGAANVPLADKTTPPGQAPTRIYSYDPRYLLFEFVSGMLMREGQAKLCATFIERATIGATNKHGVHTRSLVYQMIMGGGKTTCVAPMLALALARPSEALVTMVVPAPLLLQSIIVLRARFSSEVVRKPVFTLAFERATCTEETAGWLVAKMRHARASGGVLVTTPKAVKSLINKYIELLTEVDATPRHLYRRVEPSCRTADTLAQAINLWSARQGGVLLLDEVDMLLHPMRSELNFPIGNEKPIGPIPHRWSFAWYLLDLVLVAAAKFQSGTATAATKSGAWVAAAAPILEAAETPWAIELNRALEAGFASRRVARTPHPFLVDVSFYAELEGPLARSALSYMKSNGVFRERGGSGALANVPDDGALIEYIRRGARASSETLAAVRRLASTTLADEVEDAAWTRPTRVLNLAHELVTTILPHVLAKVRGGRS